jgi:hypothetical protein
MAPLLTKLEIKLMTCNRNGLVDYFPKNLQSGSRS